MDAEVTNVKQDFSFILFHTYTYLNPLINDEVQKLKFILQPKFQR